MARDATPPADTRRVTVSLAIATAVTLAAALPLGAIAWAARDDAPAAIEGLAFEVDGVRIELGGARLAPGTDALLVADDPTLVAAAWALYERNGDRVAGGETVGTTPFVLPVPDGGVGALGPGVYDLLVTGTQGDGNVVELAASFAIGDAQ